MKKHIAEELPVRKHAPAAAPAAKKEGGEGGGKKEQGSEKKVRQAVYDIRYRARREDIDLKQAFSQYMSNSSLSPQERAMVRAKLFGKEGGAKVAEQFENTGSDLAVDGVAGALFKVFVEGIEKPEEPIQLVYERQMESKEGTKYHVSVTDPKTGRKYTRFATREKITQLRARGLKVEMSEHEDSRERAAGAEKKRKKGLDPVAKRPEDRDGDVNNDGKKDKTDSYIYNRRDAIKKAIAKEDYVWTEATGTTSVEGQNAKKVDVMKSGEQNAVKVFPDMKEGFITEKSVSKSQQRFMGMVCAYKKGEMENASPEVVEAAKSMSKKDACDYAETKHEGLPEKVSEGACSDGGKCEKCGKDPCECDRRDKKTYRDLLKNKFRSMGAKNPMLLDDPEDEKVMKVMTSSSAKVDENVIMNLLKRKPKPAPKGSALGREADAQANTERLSRNAMRRALGDGTRSTGGLRP